MLTDEIDTGGQGRVALEARVAAVVIACARAGSRWVDKRRRWRGRWWWSTQVFSYAAGITAVPITAGVKSFTLTGYARNLSKTLAGSTRHRRSATAITVTAPTFNTVALRW
jgi:hypothetical protein